MNVYCEKCGKRLLSRKPNGLWEFQFGKYGLANDSLVDMEIHGSIRMKCLRKSCRHLNVFDFFPEKG